MAFMLRNLLPFYNKASVVAILIETTECVLLFTHHAILREKASLPMQVVCNMACLKASFDAQVHSEGLAS